MICEKCNKQLASVRIVFHDGENIEEKNLCMGCFQKFQEEHPEMKQSPDMKGFLGQMLSDLLSNIPHHKLKDFSKNINEIGQLPNPQETELRCPLCQNSLKDISNKLTLGCTECYHYFRRQIEELLLQISGENNLTQNYPKPTKDDQIKQLEIYLKQAIDQEEYEVAAQIRDDIKLLEE